MEKAKQVVIERVYTRYYLALLTYGSEQQIAEELGPDVLAVHKKGTELRKSTLEKRREERSKIMEERRAQREAERQERIRQREEQKELRRKEREAIQLPISVLADINTKLNNCGPYEEEEEGTSDEEE